MIYTPTKGFFNLTNRPKTLSKREHEKIQDTQMFLVHMQRDAKYFKEHNPTQWEKAKEMSAQLQQIIFRHWDHKELFGDAAVKQYEGVKQ